MTEAMLFAAIANKLNGMNEAASVGGLFRFRPSVQCRLLALSGQSSCARVCPLSDKSGQNSILAGGGLSAYDPSATLAVHCGNGFDAGFSPYQSTRLSRYNVVSSDWE